MKFSDIFKLSTRMFKARTSRTLLTILGMSIGIGAILFLVSLGYGLQKTLLNKITTSDALLTLDVTEAKSATVFLNRETLKVMAEMEGVGEVSPAYQLNAQGRLGDLSADFSAVVVKPSFLKLGGYRVSQGRLLNDESPQEIVVTSTVSRVFGKNADEIIGKEIKFSFLVPEQDKTGEVSKNSQVKTKRVESDKAYVVAGVIEGEDSIIYINSKSLDNFSIDHFSQVKVKCRTNQALGLVRDQLISQGFLVSALSDTVEEANKVFRAIQIVLMLFGVVALVVSAIGMFNTMTIALLERTEEIGIMKSIGASNAGISLIFVMESAIMGFLGGVCGVFIGFVSGEVFNGLINFIARRFGGESVDLFYIPLWFVLLIILFAGFVGFSTGFIPARRASHIDPLEALRYK
ncbi:MAG: ABC transporter permease [Candidatus Moranbacteria bacterium]|nr:ABC transporter permease [Candidatus Moranbacteria bacterium]